MTAPTSSSTPSEKTSFDPPVGSTVNHWPRSAFYIPERIWISIFSDILPVVERVRFG